MKNKIINKKIQYISPYFDKFETIELKDFRYSEKDLLVSEILIGNKLSLRIFYSSEQEYFCFEAYINNKRIQYIVINKIDIYDIYTEYELTKMFSNVLDFIANSSSSSNITYMDVKQDEELINLIKIYLLPSLQGNYSFDFYDINNSYICFYKNNAVGESCLLVINKEKFENRMMKHTQDYECKYIIKKDENVLDYLNQAMNETSQKSVNDIKELLLYLL